MWTVSGQGPVHHILGQCKGKGRRGDFSRAQANTTEEAQKARRSALKLMIAGSESRKPGKDCSCSFTDPRLIRVAEDEAWAARES